MASINNFFTGEFDSVLFAASGKPTVVDAELGVFMQPKPITELDRLSWVLEQIEQKHAVPKGYIKMTPNGQLKVNEAFRGLNRADAFSLDNWLFTRAPQDPEIKGRAERLELTYDDNCADPVSSDSLKNSWSIQRDMTGTVATLRSNLWPGMYKWHRVSTSVFGSVYIGDGIRNENLPFMV